MENTATRRARPRRRRARENSNGEREAQIGDLHFVAENLGSGGVLRATYLICESERRERPGSSCGEGESAPEALESTVECESAKETGETSKAKNVANVIVGLHGCKALGTLPCSTKEALEGEVRLSPLKGSLGYIDKASGEVGLLLEPEAKKSRLMAFNCGGILSSAVGAGNAKEGAAYSPESHGGYGGVIAPITPINEPSSQFTTSYTVNPETDENVPRSFEGKHIELLESYLANAERPEVSSKWSKAGEELTTGTFFEACVEIRAAVGDKAAAAPQAGAVCAEEKVKPVKLGFDPVAAAEPPTLDWGLNAPAVQEFRVINEGRAVEITHETVTPPFAFVDTTHAPECNAGVSLPGAGTGEGGACWVAISAPSSPEEQNGAYSITVASDAVPPPEEVRTINVTLKSERFVGNG